MRKIYIVRENEEDGRLLEALEAAGLSTDESDFSNPTCPRCGSSTLLAYTEGDAFELLTWYEVDASDGAKADAWFLVCSSFTCNYEEQVERVFDPMGAEIFDQDSAHGEFDEYSGIHQASCMEVRAAPTSSASCTAMPSCPFGETCALNGAWR